MALKYSRCEELVFSFELESTFLVERFRIGALLALFRHAVLQTAHARLQIDLRSLQTRLGVRHFLQLPVKRKKKGGSEGMCVGGRGRGGLTDWTSSARSCSMWFFFVSIVVLAFLSRSSFRCASRSCSCRRTALTESSNENVTECL